MKSLIAFFFLFLSTFSIRAQGDIEYPSIYLKNFGGSLPRMAAADFRLNALRLKMPYDSVLVHYGSPDSVANFPEPWAEFTAHYFPKFIVWANKSDNRVWAFDIYDSSFVTARGIKLGASGQSIDSVYPTYRSNFCQREFQRVGPYDASFFNYSEYRLYDFMPTEDEGWVIIFFTKGEVLTKMLFYVGVPE